MANEGQENQVLEQSLTQQELADNINNEGGDGNDDVVIEHDQEYIDSFKEVSGISIGDDYFKGEDGKALSKKDLMKKMITDVSSSSENFDNIEDPFVKDYLTAKAEEGFTHDTYIKNLTKVQDINDMSPADYIKKRYIDAGETEEVADEYINSKGKLELKDIADGFKEKDILKQQQDFSLENQKNITNIEKQNAESNTFIKNAITKYTDDVLRADKSPIKFSKEEVDEIEKEAIDLLSVKLVKGKNGLINTQGLQEALKDDDVLFQLIPFIVKAKNGTLKEFLLNLKNETKDKEFNKLSSNKNNMGEGSSSSGYTIDKFVEDAQ